MKNLASKLEADVDKVEEDIEDYFEKTNVGNNRVKKGPKDEVGGERWVPLFKQIH